LPASWQKSRGTIGGGRSARVNLGIHGLVG
jgi:hypothetical protein